MDVAIQLSTPEDSVIIKNLYPLYLHDLSEFDGTQPNRYGVFDASNRLTTLADVGEKQNLWWQKPAVLWPYLIQVDNRPAGFGLVASEPHVPQGVDFLLHEFFLAHPFRGQGLAQEAAQMIFRKHRGNWEIYALPNHVRAITFWRSAVNDYTAGRYEERVGLTSFGDRWMFRFDNHYGSGVGK